MIDTVPALELVKPNGNVVTVTKASDPDLFFWSQGSSVWLMAAKIHGC